MISDVLPAGGNVLGAFEAKTYDGPWTDISEDLEKLNGMLRWSRDGDRFSTGITAMFYDADWNSADQIPERAVVSGLIDPLGSLDTAVGGNTRRASLSGRLNWIQDGADQSVELYLIDYRMQLWSNFTYLLNDPVDGDPSTAFVVNGQSGRSNSFLVDGLDNNDQASGTTSNSFFSQLVIQEFVLLTHQFSPEFGRASGGVLNVVTRRAYDLGLQGTPRS